MSVAEDAPTPENVLKEPGSGLGTRVHAVPFQCAASVSVPRKPTAHALLVNTMVTLVSEPATDGRSRLGAVTCFHVLPFQCNMSGCDWPFLPKYVPTAQALDEEFAATPSRLAEMPGSGLATRFHVCPF